MEWNVIVELIMACLSPIAWLILFFVSKGKITPTLKVEKYVKKANKLISKVNNIDLPSGEKQEILQKLSKKGEN